MQGNRGAIGSFPETLGFDQGSPSSDAAIDQQICWNNVQNAAHNTLPDCLTSTSHPTNTYLSQGHTLSGWNVGEPSSTCGTLNHVSHNNERKTEHGAGSSSEECHNEPANTLLLNSLNVKHTSNPIPNVPLFVQCSSNAIPRDLNASAWFQGRGDDVDCQILDCSNNAYKSDVSQNTRAPSASSSSHSFRWPFESDGYLAGESDGSCSLEGRRLSRKRKTIEGNTGQSSMSDNSTYFQPDDQSSVWPAVPGRYNAGSSSSIATPSPNVPLEILGVGGASSGSPLFLNMTGNGENSHRNYRVRINPSRRQDSVPISVFPSVSTIMHSNVSSQQQSSRLLPIGDSLGNANPLMQSSVVHVPPPLRRTSQSSRWRGDSSSIAGESVAMIHEERNSITMPRNISEHPIFVAPHESRNSPQGSGNWNLTGGNISIAGNGASTSRTGTSSSVHPLPGPSWAPNRNPPRYPRRISELVRQSLLSSVGSEFVDPNRSSSTVQYGSSSREMALSSGNGCQGHHLSHSRSSLQLNRQLDCVLRGPYSLQTLAAAGEGRSRLVSEIRSVLDLMRRGEGLRFEELLALEERIGNVNTGLNEETVLNRLKQRKYFSIAMSTHLDVEPCCVCQEEYTDGEDIGTLECGHEFHSGCIKRWLMQKNLCPTCKTTALNK